MPIPTFSIKEVGEYIDDEMKRSGFSKSSVPKQLMATKDIFLRVTFSPNSITLNPKVNIVLRVKIELKRLSEISLAAKKEVELFKEPITDLMINLLSMSGEGITGISNFRSRKTQMKTMPNAR